MRSLIAWLLDIDPSALDPEAELGLRLDNAPEGWLVFLLAVGVIVFTIWIYRKDGRETASPGARFCLGLIRALLIAIALLILTDPKLLATKSEIRPSTVVVMVDDSFSMSLGFPYAEETLRKQVKDALGTGKIPIRDHKGNKVSEVDAAKLEVADFAKIKRIQVACQALRTSNLVEKLREKEHEVRVFTFAKTVRVSDEENRPLSLDEDFVPAGQETRVGDALREAMKEVRGMPLAGVVVITDGRQNAGEDAVLVASSRYKVQGVPIFTVSVGDPGEPKDIELSIEGPDVILPDDPSEVIAYIRQKGYDNIGTINVVLKNGNQIVESKEVKLGKSGEKIPVPLKFRETKAGKYHYTVEVAQLDGELRPENNKSTYNFQVVDKKVKVLFVEGQDLPRWEYRYLKNGLIRDHTTEADILLASFDGNFQWAGTSGKEPVEGFPTTLKAINQYDVLIFGDLNPIIFTNEQKKLIQEFVREGGGFIMVAGERFAPAAYIADPLYEMIPVVPQRAAYASPAEGLQESFPLELTGEGKRMAWTHLEPDEASNREIWENLPKLFWYYPVKKLKSFATPVVVHPFDKDEAGNKMPLVATMPYGLGRTMFIGVDSLWRWRLGVGDRYHYRFYNQAIRFLSMAKRLGGQKRFIVGVDKASYSLGDKVVVTALVKNDKFEPLDEKTVVAYLETPKGDTQTIELTRLRDRQGTYEGQFFPDQIDEYKLWLRDEKNPEVRQSEASFKVQEPRLELENPRMNEELLKAVAAAGGEGGEYFTINQLGLIPPLIEPKIETVTREEPINLWSNWLVLLLFAGLITVEWVWRKRVKML